MDWVGELGGDAEGESAIGSIGFRAGVLLGRAEGVMTGNLSLIGDGADRDGLGVGFDFDLLQVDLGAEFVDLMVLLDGFLVGRSGYGARMSGSSDER